MLGLELGTVSTVKQTTTRLGLGLGMVSAQKETTSRCRWINGLHYKCLIRVHVKTSEVN